MAQAVFLPLMVFVLRICLRYAEDMLRICLG